ncbi:uncharacterized protein LOC112117806 [Terrapene carolina triunguis]|uniref:uncharacterized protein LOC112117806 n=1 Tax=Terrapene triunguis TaxID=2587831 RepID=UPI00115688F9|nr:uncharacterized protein LOC112117806 [Terrapene carolina triunguis]
MTESGVQKKLELARFEAEERQKEHDRQMAREKARMEAEEAAHKRAMEAEKARMEDKERRRMNWRNVRTLMDREAVARPERRTALIARELVRYNIDIAALSETRLPGEGFLSEPGGGYTFFWKGQTETEDRIHGVGLAIKTLLMHQLPDFPVGISERLLKLRFPLNAKRHVTIISAYAPTLTCSDNSKEQFYEDLDRLIKATPVTDKPLLLGDFNARVGADSENWKGVIGPHGVGKMNSNGLLLLSLCSENDLTITNTLFRQANKYKTTWMHPRSKQWHLIDYAIVRRRDIRDVLITRVMRDAECWTDHRLVRTSLQLYIVPSRHKRPAALAAFHSVIINIWEDENIPQDLRDATIVSLFKNKGSKAECGKYRGISLLSVGGKIIARIILNRLIASISEAKLPESQCGFRPGRSTVDMVFAVRQIQEKCIEQNMHLYAVFIDLTKAFDTVNREALWTILTRLGCPRKFVQIIHLFHDSMTGEVLSDGATSAPFNITNGVKQGCVLAPVLFNLFFACVLNHALKDLDQGIYLKYRHDGSLFDLRRLNAKTKTVQKLLLEALFADDCALMGHTENDLQHIVNKFAEASQLFGLTISLGKTEVLHQPAPGSNASVPSISIDGTQLKVVENFKYLGSVISSDGSLDNEINARISKASQALGCLRVKVLNHHNIRMSTKLLAYRAVVLSSLLYGCETWTLYRRHIKQLEAFHTRCLRNIMKVRWQDKVPNLEVLERAQMTSIEMMIMKSQLRACIPLFEHEHSCLPLGIQMPKPQCDP